MTQTTAYKYLSPETARLLLESQTLRFSPPSALNDRRDCVGDFRAAIEEYIAILEKSVPASRDRMHQINRAQIEADIAKQLREKANFRVLSLSLLSPKTPKAEPLWAYYAASHQGICLEFDIPALRRQLEIDMRTCGAVVDPPATSVPAYDGRVEYNDMPAPWPLPSDELIPVGEQKMMDLVFRKATCWQQESEYRVIIFNDPKRSILKEPLFTWKFPWTIVQSIHLGEYASDETIEMVQSLTEGILIVPAPAPRKRKASSRPSAVWKYLSPATATDHALRNRTLRFSPLNEVKDGSPVPVLNDRRDCAFDLTDEVSERVKQYHDRGLVFADGSPPGILRDTADTPERTIEKNIHQQLRKKGLRILSLSLTDPVTTKADPLWGYYGACACGICLEFDYHALVAALEEDWRKAEKKDIRPRMTPGWWFTMTTFLNIPSPG